jgi:hypothetical protein
MVKGKRKIKLCKDCVYSYENLIERIFFHNKYLRCSHPNASKPNLVNGERKESYCENQRMEWLHHEYCGTEGKWFVSRFKNYPSVKCNCKGCRAITDLQGR